MMTLTLAATLLAQAANEPRWITLSNLPGWEGWGTILPSGWVDPSKFRRTDNPAVELPPAGKAASGPVVASAPAADPYGFLAWLNAQRAAYGLPAVAYDPNLAAWAAQNSATGFGHFVRAGRRQNAGVGDLATVSAGWLTSPAHASALFDPGISRVGIAVVNGIWTFNGD